MIIHIEGNFAISIDNQSIIKEFYSIKKVRQNLNSSLLYFHYDCDIYIMIVKLIISSYLVYLFYFYITIAHPVFRSRIRPCC